MIPDEFIDQLLSRIDIVDVIDPFVPLKKGGANYMACCPFHKEKSPSFTVSPSKQFYHCFGCGAHGSAIGFIMQYQGLSFTEAVHLLAGRAGMSVPQIHGRNLDTEHQARQRQKHNQLAGTLEQVAQHYRHNLAQHPAAQGYLKQRGLNDDIIKRYGLGYAGDHWQGLAQIASPYPSAELIENGLVIEKEGKTYDRFRHRIMFPIRNHSGQVIGFGGRVLDDSKPKYLNSPDTPLFDKGRNLYGLYEARAAIQAARRILVVEGYMDVVALAQFGLDYSVAALGTATTTEHIKILLRQTDNIYFCFDGDRAGRQAASRALENALPQLKDGKSLHFLFLPEEHDPDSYIRTFGKDRFEDALLHQSRPLSAYFLEMISENIDLSSQEGKAKLIKKAGSLLNQISQAPALAYLLKQTLSQQVGIDLDNLAYLIGQEAPKRHIAEKRYTLPRKTARHPRMLTLAEKQIRSLLRNPEWASYTDLPESMDWDDELACLAALAALLKQTGYLKAGQIAEAMRHTPHFNRLTHLIGHQWQDDPYPPSHLEDEKQQFLDGMNKIMHLVRHRQIEQLKAKLNGQGLTPEEKKLLHTLLQHRAT